MSEETKMPSRYHQLIEKIFFDGYRKGATEIPFERKALKEAASALKMVLPDNLGDVIYSIRFRTPMPAKVLATQPRGREWIIELVGRAKYRFRLVSVNRVVPNPNLAVIRISDNTPEIISAYALDDEQALLAKVRYNRLIDIFLGLTTFSLQNHLRTSVKGIGQIEIDELYVGLDKYGCHYIIPVQAKGGRDQISRCRRHRTRLGVLRSIRRCAAALSRLSLSPAIRSRCLNSRSRMTSSRSWKSDTTDWCRLVSWTLKRSSPTVRSRWASNKEKEGCQ